MPKKEYKEVEGELFIHRNGKITLDGKTLFEDEILHIPVKKMKQIIKDAKEGII